MPEDPREAYQQGGVRRPGCRQGWNPAKYGVPAGLSDAKGPLGTTDAYRVPGLAKTTMCRFWLRDGWCRRGAQRKPKRRRSQLWQADAEAGSSIASVIFCVPCPNILLSYIQQWRPQNVLST